MKIIWLSNKLMKNQQIKQEKKLLFLYKNVKPVKKDEKKNVKGGKEV